MGIKLTVIGGSGLYTPLLFEAIINWEEEIGFDEICLNGRTKPKLEKITNLCRNLVENSDREFEVSCTTSLPEALTGADYVLTQIRVGGMKSRAYDEEFPLEYDLIGEETVGVGGFANGLRTVPVMLEIGKEIEKYAPKALVINLTNPASVVQQALNKETDLDVISVCDLPVGVINKIAKLVDAVPEEITVKYQGLNHLGWYTDLYLKGESILDEVLKQVEELELGIDGDLIRSMEAIPVPYLKYYYHHRREVANAKEKEKLRAQELMGNQEEINQSLEENPDQIPEIIYQRGAIWYSHVIVPFIAALNQNQEQKLILNIVNDGLISGLDDDVIVEVPTVVNSAGIKPLQVKETPLKIKGLMQTEANYRQLATKAAISQKKGDIIQALLANPLLSSYKVAEKIWKDNL